MKDILKLALVCVVVYFGYRFYTKIHGKDQFYNTVASQRQSTKIVVDAKGNTHSIGNTVLVQNPKAVADFLNQEKNIIELKTHILGLKKDLKNLQYGAVTSNITNNNYSVALRDSVIYDTIHASYATYRTPWTEKHIFIKNDSAFIRETNYDTCFVATYWERKWFLGKKHFKTEASFANKNTKGELVYSILKK